MRVVTYTVVVDIEKAAFIVYRLPIFSKVRLGLIYYINSKSSTVFRKTGIVTSVIFFIRSVKGFEIIYKSIYLISFIFYKFTFYIS